MTTTPMTTACTTLRNNNILLLFASALSLRAFKAFSWICCVLMMASFSSSDDGVDRKFGWFMFSILWFSCSRSCGSSGCASLNTFSISLAFSCLLLTSSGVVVYLFGLHPHLELGIDLNDRNEVCLKVPTRSIVFQFNFVKRVNAKMLRNNLEYCAYVNRSRIK